jgi:hypothetical protein
MITLLMPCGMVPENFRYPKCNTKTIWDLWWDGRRTEKIQGFSFLNGFDFTNTTDKTNWSKSSKLMTNLVDRALMSHLISSKSQLRLMRPGERDLIFSEVFGEMIKEAFKEADAEALDRRRIGEMAYTTVYEYAHVHRATKNKKRKHFTEDYSTESEM